MRLHRSLRLGGVAAELAVVYREGGAYDAPILQALREAARAVRCEGMIGARGGIHMINLDVHGEQALSLLTAVCAHNGARDLQRTGLPPAGYTPADILPVEKSDIIQKEDESLLNTEKGVFTGHSFRVTDDPRLPWCHVLSNPVFGHAGVRQGARLYLGGQRAGKQADTVV